LENISFRDFQLIPTGNKERSSAQDILLFCGGGEDYGQMAYVGIAPAFDRVGVFGVWMDFSGSVFAY